MSIPSFLALTTADLKKLVNDHYPKLLLGVIGGALLGALLAFILPVWFASEVIFQDVATESRGYGSRDLLSLPQLTTVKNNKASVAHAYFRSQQLLASVVDDLGLQIQVTLPWRHTLLQRVKRVIRAELRQNFPAQDHFCFEHVLYHKRERRTHLNLLFTAPDRFEVRQGKITLVQGRVGELVQGPGWQFLMRKTPACLQLNSPYPLTLFSLADSCRALKSHLQLRPVPGTSRCFQLSLIDEEGSRAQQIASHLMEAYISSLQQIDTQLTDRSLNHLNERLSQLRQQIENQLSAQTQTVMQTWLESGTLEAKQQFKLFNTQRKQLEQELHQLTSQQNQLTTYLTQHSPLPPVCPELTQLNNQIDHLRKRRELLLINDPQEELQTDRPSAAPPTATRSDNQDRLHQQVSQLKQRPPTSLSRQRIEQFHQQHRLQLIDDELGDPPSPDMQGAMLEQVEHACAQQDATLDRLTADLTYFQQVNVRVQKRADGIFSTLASTLPDLSGRMLAQQIEDLLQKTLCHQIRTDQELTVLNLNIDQLIQELDDYLTQTSELTQCKIKDLQATRTTLHRKRLHLFDQKILSLQAKLQEQAAEHQELLNLRCKQLTTTLTDLKAHAQSLPNRWLAEQQLTLHREETLRLFDLTTKVIEQQMLELQTPSCQAIVLDPPTIPTQPLSPHLSVAICLGSLLGGWGSFAYVLFSQVKRGLPTTGAQLLRQGKHVLGSFSDLNDSKHADRGATLNRSATFIGSSKGVVALIGLLPSSSYPDQLAQTLCHKGLVPFLLSIEFTSPTGSSEEVESPKFCSKNLPPPALKHGYHYLHVSYATRWGAQLLTQDHLATYLDEQQNNYDLIVLSCSPSRVDSFEAQALSHLSKKIILNAHATTLPDLEPYFAVDQSASQIAYLTL